MDDDGDFRAALAAIAKGIKPDKVESRTLDFKEDRAADRKRLAELLAETAVCFANTIGGRIVIGVDNDQSGPGAFLGTALTEDMVRRTIYERTVPPLSVVVSEDTTMGARLIVVTVPEGVDVHADSQGRVYRRIDNQQCKPLSPGEVDRLREERRGVDWSAARSGRTGGDTSGAAVAEARAALARLSDERQVLSQDPLPELLRALGVVDGKDRLNLAGDLLLCDPARGSSAAIVYIYRDSPGGEAVFTKRLAGPLISVFAEISRLIAARSRTTPLTQGTGQVLEIQDFPDLAVREAVANALVHRDYRITGAVTIEHSPSSFVVTSPGPLVAGVTPDNILTHPSKPRNGTLAKAMRQLGLAEETGRGVDRMYRELIRAGKEPPSIGESEDGVRVAFVGGAPNERIARFVAQLPDDERGDTDTLLLVFALCSRQAVDAVYSARLLQKNIAEAAETLRRLSEEPVAIVEPSPRTRRWRYPAYRLRAEAMKQLGPAVRYRRRTMDDTDRKIVAHVREYGKITNATIRNLFDVDVYGARDIVSDRVERRLLVKQSERKSGPGIEYGPGEAFPVETRRRRDQASS